ncbi:MAG: hypothetical protein ACRECD_02245 [Burkholderiaceae bacterium]
MKHRNAIFLIAACALSCWAWGQNDSRTSAIASCPAPSEVSHWHLYGLWRAEFEGLSQDATLLLEKHPELAESVRGTLRRDGSQALLAGDVDQGELNLDESLDGLSISATWTGQVVDNSCGKEIRGTWQHAADSATRRFVLRRQPGWQ